MKPTIGRIVLYRSRSLLGYTVPAIITATADTLHPEGVEAGHVPPLTGEDHVHLHVLSPAIPGESPLRPLRREDEPAARWGGWVPSPRVADLRKQVETAERPAAPNVGGGYQEWDVPQFEWGPDLPGLAALWTGPGEPPRDCTPVPAEQLLGTWAWPPRNT